MASPNKKEKDECLMQLKHSVDLAQECSVLRFAEQMYAYTATDGTLYLNNWYDCYKDDLLTCHTFRASIKWDENSFDDVLDTFQDLLEDLTVIADCYEQLDGTVETARNLLPNESVVATYFIYVEPFDAKNNLQLLSQITGRVGDDLCGFYTILHAQRLCKLLALNAPKLVIRNECRHLFAAWAVFNCAESFEEI